MEKEHYLGDGLYASHDGHQIVLRAPREHGDHWVGLEPTTFANLLMYAKALKGTAVHGFLLGFVANERNPPK